MSIILGEIWMVILMVTGFIKIAHLNRDDNWIKFSSRAFDAEIESQWQLQVLHALNHMS